MNRLLTAVLAFAFLLSGCTKKGQLDKDTLYINLMQEPPSLDWSIATDTTSALVLTNIMDTLVEYNLSDPELAPVPALAKSWTPSQGAKVWTFTLRDDVKWTDGVPFTAQHVIDAWERIMNPKTASEYAYFLFAIKNAKAYNEGKIKDFKQVGVKINDKKQLVIELERPMGYFPLLLTHHSTCPLRIDVIEKHGVNKWTDPQNIVTLGAYKLKSWDHDQAIVLERNEDYYGEKAKIKNIHGYMINEYSTALNLYDSGKLDFQETVPYKELPQYRTKPGFRGVPSLSIYYYGMNVTKPPFDNIKVRKAFAQAIDRKQITDLLGAGQAPLTSWIPTGMFGYEHDIGMPFNAEAASKLLDEAGFKDRSKFPKLSIAFNSNENHQRVAENVQAQLKKNLGVELQLQNEEWKVYLAHLKADPPALFRMGWLADYPDPDNFMNLMTSYSDNNRTKWKNKAYDGLIEQGAAAMDKDKRRALYAQAQKLLTETDTAVIPLFSDVRPILLSERVQNFPVNALNRWVLRGVSFK